MWVYECVCVCYNKIRMNLFILRYCTVNVIDWFLNCFLIGKYKMIVDNWEGNFRIWFLKQIFLELIRKPSFYELIEIRLGYKYCFHSKWSDLYNGIFVVGVTNWFVSIKLTSTLNFVFRWKMSCEQCNNTVFTWTWKPTLSLFKLIKIKNFLAIKKFFVVVDQFPKCLKTFMIDWL